MGSPNFIDLTGKLFGRLTVLEQANRLRRKVPRWLCRCECGGSVVVEGKNLRGGLTRSCGCLSREVASARSRTHGLTDSAEYKIWCGMKRRCYNPHEHCYQRYGGRGIRVCDRWVNSFKNFLSDMGQRPDASHSIERIDPDGDYSPANCKWIPFSQQSDNRRNSIRLEHGGTTLPLKEWAGITGIPYSTLQARLSRGWSAEKALSTPLMENRRNRLSRQKPRHC